MDTILIVCGAGASSTFLASRMRALAAARSLPITVEATSQGELDSRLPSARVLLVGPHLHAIYSTLAERAHEFGVSAALLPPDSFGASGANDALTQVSGLLETGQSSTHPLPEGISHG